MLGEAGHMVRPHPITPPSHPRTNHTNQPEGTAQPAPTQHMLLPPQGTMQAGSQPQPCGSQQQPMSHSGPDLRSDHHPRRPSLSHNTPAPGSSSGGATLGARLLARGQPESLPHTVSGLSLASCPRDGLLVLEPVSGTGSVYESAYGSEGVMEGGAYEGSGSVPSAAGSSFQPHSLRLRAAMGPGQGGPGGTLPKEDAGAGHVGGRRFESGDYQLHETQGGANSRSQRRQLVLQQPSQSYAQSGAPSFRQVCP